MKIFWKLKKLKRKLHENWRTESAQKLSRKNSKKRKIQIPFFKKKGKNVKKKRSAQNFDNKGEISRLKCKEWHKNLKNTRKNVSNKYTKCGDWKENWCQKNMKIPGKKFRKNLKRKLEQKENKIGGSLIEKFKKIPLKI